MTSSSIQAISLAYEWACRDLNALFKELVQQSGSISEQEFWAGRQHLLRRQQGNSGAQKQRTGVANAMVVGRPSADGKTNKVCINSTWQLCQTVISGLLTSQL